MKTSEILDALASAGMKISEVEAWLKSQNNSSVKSLFPIVYKVGNNFEVLPELIPSRKGEVWGYELLPGIFLAKKCGVDGNVESTTWDNCKAFAKKMSLNGKSGSLPSKEILKKNWSEELRNKIRAMDRFLCENAVDAESRSADDIDYCGIPWCSEVDGYSHACYFYLIDGDGHWGNESSTHSYDRVVVAFD